MSVEEHHVIVVTGPLVSHKFDDPRMELYQTAFEKARCKAVDLFSDNMVSPTVWGMINALGTFIVGPDGSYAGGDESDLYDKLREQFIAYLKTLVYEDGSSPLRWFEVRYDSEGAEVTRAKE